MSTCEAVERRLNALAERSERAIEPLRTRVDIALEGQNQSLLRSMEQNARRQLRLQQTVEGLSVVAISYYLVSMLSYVFKGLEEARVWKVHAPVAIAISAPIVVCRRLARDAPSAPASDAVTARCPAARARPPTE